MLPSRYELSDLQWEKIKDFLLGRAQHVGRTAADNRLFVNGVLWALRSGARWADLPERYGKYKSVHKRFVRSRHPSETARYNASTTKNSTNNAIASSDASANSNVFAASPLRHSLREIAARYEKSKTCFHALVALAGAWSHLTLYVDTA
jgi:transposase